MVTASRDWAMTWAVTYSRDWAVIILKMPWLSCDLAVTELWPRRDWSLTSPSRDWAVIIGPRSRDHHGHRELTMTIYFLMGVYYGDNCMDQCGIHCLKLGQVSMPETREKLAFDC